MIVLSTSSHQQITVVENLHVDIYKEETSRGQGQSLEVYTPELTDTQSGKKPSKCTCCDLLVSKVLIH